LSDVDLSTQSGAAAAIGTLDNVLKTLSSQLAIMGAVRNRLEVSINNMTTAAIQTNIALGRIKDADFASEMASLTKDTILSQAASQVLAGAQLSKSNLTKLLDM